MFCLVIAADQDSPDSRLSAGFAAQEGAAAAACSRPAFPEQLPVAEPPSSGRPPGRMGTESGSAGALLGQAGILNLQTGNLLNWGRLRKKCPATPSEEVSAGPRPASPRSPSASPAGAPLSPLALRSASLPGRGGGAQALLCWPRHASLRRARGFAGHVASSSCLGWQLVGRLSCRKRGIWCGVLPELCVCGILH